MLRLCSVATAVVLCLVSVAAHATTYLPVTFQDLVAQADVIFVGDVVDVRPFAMPSRDGTVIKTRVTFRIDDPLLGSTGTPEVLEFFGGEVDGVGMAIAGMPRFKVGDRHVVFARRARSINPVVGFTQGLLQVRRDANGIERVLTVDGFPVARPESIGISAQPTAAAGMPMRLSDLRDRIRSAVAEARRR